MEVFDSSYVKSIGKSIQIYKLVFGFSVFSFQKNTEVRIRVRFQTCVLKTKYFEKQRFFEIKDVYLLCVILIMDDHDSSEQ